MRSRARDPPMQSPPNLADDGAVVILALAVADAGFQYLLVQRREWKLLASLVGLRQHQFDVLESLTNPALRGELAAHHLGALGVHHLRIRCGFACHGEKAVGVEPETLGEHQAFGEREAIEAEDEIDRELGTAAIADRAHVKTRWREGLNNRAHALEFLRIAAKQPDAFAFAHLFAGSRDRRLDEM